MKIIKNYNDEELTMQIEGRIDTVTSQDLEGEITSEFDNFNSLILDFENVEYISSAGLRVLILTESKLKEKNGSLELINVHDTIKEILRMSGIDKLLTIQ